MKILAPYGLLPVNHPSGAGTPIQPYGSVETPPALTLFRGQPIRFDENGKIQPAFFAGTPATPAPVSGVFHGISYSQPDGPWVNRSAFIAGTNTFNQGISGTNEGNTYNTSVRPYIFYDPEIVYSVQANGPMDMSTLFKTFDIDLATIMNGNVITGISAATLSNTEVPDGNGQFTVIALDQRTQLQGNTWGDEYTCVLVKLTKFN